MIRLLPSHWKPGAGFDKHLPVRYVGGGIYVREGVPQRLAFIEMCEMISTYWLAKEKSVAVKAEWL